MTRPSNPIHEYDDGQKLSAHTKSLGSSVELHRPMAEDAVSLYGRQEPLFVKNHKVDCFKIKQNTQKILHCQNRSKTICISLHRIFPQNNSYLMYSSSFPCDLFLVICLFLAHVNPASKQPTVDFAIQKGTVLTV
jgi:hypothetical protein